PVPIPVVMSTESEANTASVAESSWNPMMDDISPAEVVPASSMSGNAERTAATSGSRSVSYVLNSSPARGRSPARPYRHCRMILRAPSTGSISSLWPTAIRNARRFLRVGSGGVEGLCGSRAEAPCEDDRRRDGRHDEQDRERRQQRLHRRRDARV